MPSENSRAAQNLAVRKSSLPSVLMLLWLIALVIVALYGLQPPDVRPASAPADVFSAERALVHVRALATLPHPLGTPAHDQTRDYLVSQLTRLGLSPRVQSVPVVASGWNRPYRAATISNVWVRLPGRAPAGTLLLAAHYDSVPTGPGASDDAAAIAGLLETVRALQARQPHAAFRNNIVLLFTDGEEAGLFGARAFIESFGKGNTQGSKTEERRQKTAGFASGSSLIVHRSSFPQTVALNFEARGAGGLSLMFETGPENGALVRRFAHAVPQPTASSLFYAVYKILPNDTDFTEFRRAGMRGLNFAFIDKVSHYHTALDNVARLDARSLQQHGDNMLGLARDLGNAPLDQAARPDAIYFNVTRSMLAIYPEAWAVPLAVCATLLTVIYLAMEWRAKRITPAAVGIDLLRMLTALVFAAGAGALLTRLLPAIAPSPRSILHIGNSVLAGVILLALGLTWAVLTGFAPRPKASSERLQQDSVSQKDSVQQSALRQDSLAASGGAAGAVLCWLLLTWLTALELPGGSYLFAWPLLFVLAANLAAPGAVPTDIINNFSENDADKVSDKVFNTGVNRSYVVLLAQMIGAAAAILLIIPVLCLLFSALAVTALPIIALLVALTVGLLHCQVTLAARLVPSRPYMFPLLAAIAGIVLTGAGTAALRPTAARPRFDSIFYALNVDADEAVWASDDPRPDAWTTQFLGEHPQRSLLPDALPVSAATFLHAPAFAVPLAPPTITLLDNQLNQLNHQINHQSSSENRRRSNHQEQGQHQHQNELQSRNPPTESVRTLNLRVASPRHAPLVEIAVEGSKVVEATVEGQPVKGNTGAGHAWSLLYFNLPSDGVALTLRVKTAFPNAPIVLRAIDRSYGLPVLSGKSYAPRPDDIIAAPTASWYQDAALVSKTYRF